MLCAYFGGLSLCVLLATNDYPNNGCYGDHLYMCVLSIQCVSHQMMFNKNKCICPHCDVDPIPSFKMIFIHVYVLHVALWGWSCGCFKKFVWFEIQPLNYNHVCRPNVVFLCVWNKHNAQKKYEWGFCHVDFGS